MTLVMSCLKNTRLNASSAEMWLTIISSKIFNRNIGRMCRLTTYPLPPIYKNDVKRSYLRPNKVGINRRTLSDNKRRTNLIIKRYFRTSSAAGKEATVKAPAFPESVTDGDVKYNKAVGDEVQADEVVCEIETDKTAIAVAAPESGRIKELIVPDGAQVKAGQPLFKMELGPVAKKPATVKAAGKESAVRGRMAPVRRGAQAVRPPGPAPQPPGPAAAQGTIKKVPMPRIRQAIAKRLKAAQNEAAMLTTFNEIDMSNLINMRSRFQSAFEKTHKIKLGFMSPFLKASAYAIKDQPIVNATIVGSEIWYRESIDISVAVATPKGLVVPVIRDVGSKSYAEIERNLAELAHKARDGAITAEEMKGGTFSITNGGVFGSLISTPIINPPQSAILGMHMTKPRPVAVNNQVVIRPMMYVALTYDHRLIDGREAVNFLKKIKEVVEDIDVMVLNL